MKKMKWVGSALLMATALNSFAVNVRGMPSCGQWLKDRKGSPTVVTVASLSWLTGFLSGIATESNRDFLRGVDAEAMYAYVDNYCQVNPLEEVGAAAYDLKRALEQRKGIKP